MNKLQRAIESCLWLTLEECSENQKNSFKDLPPLEFIDTDFKPTIFSTTDSHTTWQSNLKLIKGSTTDNDLWARSDLLLHPKGEKYKRGITYNIIPWEDFVKKKSKKITLGRINLQEEKISAPPFLTKGYYELNLYDKEKVCNELERFSGKYVIRCTKCAVDFHLSSNEKASLFCSVICKKKYKRIVKELAKKPIWFK